LAAFCDWLVEKSGGRPEEIAVAIEVPHGPVVETLMERGFGVYALHPKQTDRLRDRFTMVGAKDDRFDAQVMADALRTDRHRLRRLASTDATIVELREWSRIGEELKRERVRLVNRIEEQLWRYDPQALKLTDDIACNWFLELWALAPTPAKAARIAEKSVAHIRTLTARLKLANSQLADVDRQLDALSAKVGNNERDAEPGQPVEQRDVMILRSLPGIGRTIAATLLSEAPEPLQRRDYHAFRSLCGTAPVTRRSGKSKTVLMRYACHHRLRDAVYHWARVAIQHDDTSRSKYVALRKRGKSHGQALRVVADRRCLRDAEGAGALRSRTSFPAFGRRHRSTACGLIAERRRSVPTP
jgi:transposase